MTVLVQSPLVSAIGRPITSAAAFARADVGVTLLILGGVLSVTYSTGRSLLARLSRLIGVAITLAAIFSSLVVVIEYTLHVNLLPDILLLPGIDHGQIRDSMIIGLPLAIANVLLGLAFLLRFRNTQTTSPSARPSSHCCSSSLDGGATRCPRPVWLCSPAFWPYWQAGSTRHANTAACTGPLPSTRLLHVSCGRFSLRSS